ncbi:hypothetical protein CHLNCDRAFT_137816 [Chlorella variabilis]|uniref:DUF4336 domain-containing protein n=1 Tax=Chlorella variabilis TaxID=554065 RepID=E1Z4K1_CHLVA|nr:hypothetical protein CHLNCDRAFT_137816 [Chlorella variabilis]EFN59359.1 hypothetical protein CHLNCDRAFT_137816 [Chlorella variabilis]|eukprot:XP_005851461.1 hypothetical protein CHLNCDRAFT_137816 [Chlorella variabilis]
MSDDSRNAMSGFTLTSQLPAARGKELWTLDGLLGGRLSSFPVRMTIIRLGGRGLLLVSSFPPTPQVLALLRPLGEVRLVLAPNAMHCLWGAHMRDACPGAVLAGPPKAAQRFPASRWDVVVGTPHDFDALLAQLGLSPRGQEVQVWTTIQANPWMQEVVLLHRPSRALILTDLAFNFQRGGDTPLPGGPLGAVLRSTYLRLAGGYRTCCPTTPVRWLLKDADAMCAIVDAILLCDFDQVVVAHGDVVAPPDGKKAFTEGAAAFFRDAARRRRESSEGGAGRQRAYLAAAAVAGTAVALAAWWRAGR